MVDCLTVFIPECPNVSLILLGDCPCPLPFVLFFLAFILLQLGDGLVYEAVDDANVFPHFYGPSRGFSPLPLDAVTKAEKLSKLDGKFHCPLLI